MPLVGKDLSRVCVPKVCSCVLKRAGYAAAAALILPLLAIH